MFLPENAKKMFRKLVELARRLGRDPTFDEVRDEPEIGNPNNFAFYFGSFTNALKEAHRVAFKYEHEPRWMQSQVDNHIEIEEVVIMPRKLPSDEELIRNFLKLCDNLNHFPSRNEVNNDPDCASAPTYIDHFKTKHWRGLQEFMERQREAIEKTGSIQIEPEPQPEAKPEEGPTPAEPELPAMIAEVMSPAEIVEDDVKLISLLPRTIVEGVPIADYASVLRMRDSMPLFRSIAEIPICKDYEILQILVDGRPQPFPEPSEGVYYIVDRKIAHSALLCGRSTEDLLIPNKFTKEGSVTTILEFTTL